MREYGMAILGLLVIMSLFQATKTNQCLTMLDEVNPKRVVHLDGKSLSIPFELSRRPTQRLVSIIMKIYLMEVLGYPDVTLVERDDKFNVTSVFSELSEKMRQYIRVIPNSMINMEVWIPPQYDTTIIMNHYDAKEAGSLTTPGRFGWFIPAKLIDINDNWRTFAIQETAARFDVDETVQHRINKLTIKNSTNNQTFYYCEESYCKNGMYIPEQCESQQPCALLLAADSDVTSFVKKHIDEMKLYVKVAWVGPNLSNLIKTLTKEYVQRNVVAGVKKRSLIVLHWTPSNIIPNEEKFIAIDFPRCGSRGLDSGCNYESNRLVKVLWSKLETIAKFAWEAINRVNFEPQMYEGLIDKYNNLITKNKSEEEIACSWLKENLNYTLSKWMPNNTAKDLLFIGGIFPMSGSSYTAKTILVGAKMAKEALNNNNTILRDYDIMLVASDGQCKSDMVMKSFIDYVIHHWFERLIGVLGPACSETVEPLVGVSKHYKTVIISYGAEGSSFNDRTRYPYFFRTVGENKQYKHVYLELFKKFGWNRVAALTEDGQKYTEYISYMQDMLRDNGIDFIANIKFPRVREDHEMSQYLADLKQKRARIIIADVDNSVARQVMCEAYKQNMTATQGYVWFLPLWLEENWYNTTFHNKSGVPCTINEMQKAINGYFSISHSYFAPDDSIMQEGKTVRQWRNNYEKSCREMNETPSNYAGYAYDAMWTYAFAMDRLIKENQSYIFDLHSDNTIDRLTTIIAETDFYGVSGRINFHGGPSRFSDLMVSQYIGNETRTVGKYYPNISEVKSDIIGGKLELFKSAIVWLSGTIPDDGLEPPAHCFLRGISEVLDVSCETSIVITNIIGFGILGIILMIAFIAVKIKYDEKVRLQKKVMESFGLDPRQNPCNFDEWEIPRERVVMNRIIGTGAFAIVYGGEAFFPEKGWQSVAVKCLKNDSSTDEQLDFLSEMQTMKKFDHKNIVKFYGVCVQCTPVLTVMEFMLYGDLRTYLLARKSLIKGQTQYKDTDEISDKKLTCMALDIARALSYLAQLKFIHRDVATRNCLVNSQRVVKLCDFGMTRSMYEENYYRLNKRVKLPVRWMSPESLEKGLFTPASDVWAYGVVLYEIVSFGDTPFSGMNNDQVISHTMSGKIIKIPKSVKPQLEKLMKSCWSWDPIKRPRAPEIVDFLATHPRALTPCVDIPKTNVNLDNINDLDFSLNDNRINFSMELPWPQPPTSTTSTTTTNASVLASVFDTNDLSQNTSLLDINIDNNNQHNNDDNNQILVEIQTSDQDSSIPLLNNSTTSIPKHIQCINETKVQKNPPKYVNYQPGNDQLINHCNNIQMPGV